MTLRERFFECVFVSEGNEYQFHFRAWDEAEAAERFRATLCGYGVRSPGTLLVRNARGHLVIEAEYAPSAAEHGAP